jgi:ribosomal protein L37E
MDQPLQVHSPNEIPYYLMVTSCAKCGHGPLVPQDPQAGPADVAEGDAGADECSVQARCRRCGAEHAFRFRWPQDTAAGAPAEGVSPTDQPSRAIGLGQWVGLYSYFSDASSSADSPAESRALARQASLCLAEALKFYGREELPPESAFYCETSRAAFRANPANYARTRLRELQALLPAPVHPAVPADGQAPQPHPHPWWKFWEK